MEGMGWHPAADFSLKAHRAIWRSVCWVLGHEALWRVTPSAGTSIHDVLRAARMTRGLDALSLMYIILRPYGFVRSK